MLAVLVLDLPDRYRIPGDAPHKGGHLAVILWTWGGQSFAPPLLRRWACGAARTHADRSDRVSLSAQGLRLKR